jgi:hypothetical protein
MLTGTLLIIVALKQKTMEKLSSRFKN